MNSAHRHLRHRSPHRRPHRAAGILVTALVVVAWLWGAGVLGAGNGGIDNHSAPGAAPGAALVPVASTSYVVQPGDTLWSVARSIQPSGDVRPLVDELARHTAGGRLRAGQRIPLP